MYIDIISYSVGFRESKRFQPSLSIIVTFTEEMLMIPIT